jgi:hypothetical protein
MRHIFFLGNYLFRMYEIHVQYNWMLSLPHVIFQHNLHLRLRPYASAKQGHACLPCTSSFPVHVAMSSLHESRSPLPEALNLCIQRPTVLLSTAQLPYTAHNRL